MIRRYTVLDKVGHVVMIIGGLTLLLSMDIDLDQSRDGAWLLMLIAMFVSGVLIWTGIALSNFYKVEAFFTSCLIVTSAWLCRRMKKPSKALKQCYRVYRKFGTYSNTFIQCIALYEEYVDSLYYEEACDEQSK